MGFHTETPLARSARAAVDAGIPVAEVAHAVRDLTIACEPLAARAVSAVFDRERNSAAVPSVVAGGPAVEAAGRAVGVSGSPLPMIVILMAARPVRRRQPHRGSHPRQPPATRSRAGVSRLPSMVDRRHSAGERTWA